MNNKNNFAAQTLKKAKVKLESASEALTDRFNDMEYKTNRYVKHNPYKSLAYSLLVGVVLAKLIRLRK